MAPPETENLKARVRDYWNQQSCDTQVAQSAKFSREYFEEIERFRYFDQAFIHSFAQFTRYHGKQVLEVGFGAGTDFIQWLRAGAKLSGIDLTLEGLANVQHRISAYGLPEPETLRVADAENLPFPENTFDLGYSFGVLHHSPNTERALAELVRVVKPGGEIKVMLYNRRCIYAVSLWIKHALLRGKPWKNLRWVMWNHLESIGTKGYTPAEIIRILSRLGMSHLHIHTDITAADWLSASALPPLNWCFRAAIRLAGHRYAWRPTHYVARITDAPGKNKLVVPIQSANQVLLTGNPLGFFHCIRAAKTT
jgi:ubiquinone/menaquinone biosynthesis C-methylase UbiE